MTVSRPYTTEEARNTFLSHLGHLAHYWATIDMPDGPKTPLDRCNGLVFSILSAIDGATLNHPSIDLSMAPCPEDREYHIENEENYWEPGIFNDCQLHDLWPKFQRLP